MHILIKFKYAYFRSSHIEWIYLVLYYPTTCEGEVSHRRDYKT